MTVYYTIHMIQSSPDALFKFNDVMWKRLNRSREKVTAIIVAADGMDYYTNETGAFILECIEKETRVGRIFELLHQASTSEEESTSESIILGAEEFLNLLIKKEMITLVHPA